MARQMKDSGVEWIGQIPEEWKLSKIGAIYEERNEKVSDTDFQPLSVTKQGVIPQLESAAKSNDSDNRKLIRKNDFVINSRSDRRGSCGISEYDGSCSLINTVLKPRRNMCNAYYGFVFRSECFADEFYRWGNGIVDDLWSTKWSNMKRIYIPAPSLQEQRCIADYLDRKCSQIDAIIARQQEVIEKLKAYKLSVITEAVTKGLNPDVPMKDSGIPWVGNICNHYALSRVGAFCFVTKLAGFEYTDIMSSAISDTGEVPIVRAQNVRMFNFNDNIDEYIGLDVSQKLYRCALNKKCLLITFIGAGIGDVCVFSKTMRYHLAPNVAKIEIRDEYKTILDEEYLMFYLGSLAGKGEISKISKASAQPSLSMGTIRGITIAVPPIDEQREISEYLSKKIAFIDKVVRDKESIIENLLAYKSSLIYEVVTGKKEV